MLEIRQKFAEIEKVGKKEKAIQVLTTYLK